jgi:hypothetical protein
MSDRARAATVWIIWAAPEFLACSRSATRFAFDHLRMANRAMPNNAGRNDVSIRDDFPRLPTGACRTDYANESVL